MRGFNYSCVGYGYVRLKADRVLLALLLFLLNYRVDYRYRTVVILDRFVQRFFYAFYDFVGFLVIPGISKLLYADELVPNVMAYLCDLVALAFDKAVVLLLDIVGVFHALYLLLELLVSPYISKIEQENKVNNAENKHTENCNRYRRKTEP